MGATARRPPVEANPKTRHHHDGTWHLTLHLLRMVRRPFLWALLFDPLQFKHALPELGQFCFNLPSYRVAWAFAACRDLALAQPVEDGDQNGDRRVEDGRHPQQLKYPDAVGLTKDHQDDQRSHPEDGHVGSSE